MIALGVILARGGSKGLPDKCVRPLLGRPVIAYTFDHVRESRLLTGAVFSTDSEPAKAVARAAGIEVIDRPEELATDTATVDEAARHAVLRWEKEHGVETELVVLLYGNIPVRPPGTVDRAIEKLRGSGADSVRSVAPVSKQHPDWVHRLEGDRMSQLRPNSIYRRQDLEPLYYHDGAAVVVTRAALFAALDTPEDHQAFLGRDRRALVHTPEDAVDIDGPVDLYLAEAMLRSRAAGGESGSLDNAGSKVGQVSIGERVVGRGRPTFIVAEAGVNHSGSVSAALELVDAAAEAGADAVKFQVFRAVDLVAEAAPPAEYQKRACGEKSQREMLAKLELTDGDFARIREHCDRRAIVFLATPFCAEDVERVTRLGVPAIKIGSTGTSDRMLLDAAAAARLPLIVSTGAAKLEEIRAGVDCLRSLGAGGRTVLLHCISCYPAPTEAMNLRAIASLRETFGVPCGLSDHSLSVMTGGWAVAVGACVLEKHFTLDNSARGPDHAMSLTPDRLADYISGVREVERALGDGKPGMSDLESEVRAVARKSVVCACNIRAGSRITAESLTLKRPGTGIPGSEMDSLIGREAVVDILCDTVLSWDMVK